MAPCRSIEDRLSAILPTLYTLTRADEFPALATSSALALVGADKSEFTEIDLESGDFFTYVSPRPSILDDLKEARQAHMGNHPGLQVLIRTGGSDVLLISDFGVRNFRASGLYTEFYRKLGVEDQLGMGIAGVNERRRVAVTLDRGRPGFTPDDRRAMSLLRPHLVQARRNSLHFSAALATPVQEGSKSARFELLTERQQGVVAQMAAGLTNIQIARTLDISPGTVRKHIENIMRVLNLPTRTAVAVEHIRARQSATEPAWTAFVGSMFAGAVAAN